MIGESFTTSKFIGLADGSFSFVDVIKATGGHKVKNVAVLVRGTQKAWSVGVIRTERPTTGHLCMMTMVRKRF